MLFHELLFKTVFENLFYSHLRKQILIKPFINLKYLTFKISSRQIENETLKFLEILRKIKNIF